MTVVDAPPAQAVPPGRETDFHEYPDQSQVVRILLALMAGMFLAALDQTIVSTAIRTIADDLGGLEQQAWATTAYLITSTIATPLYGKLSDIYGRRRFFLFAIAVFIVGSALCSLATSMYMLAALRAVQGIGAGGLFSLALAIVGDIVPARERARYQGYFLAVFGTASVLGPVVGGLLADQNSIFGIPGWRYVFLINVPIGIAALVGVYINLHTPQTRVHHRVDWWGAVMLVVALVPLLIVAEQGQAWGWTSATSIACYLIGVVGVVLLVLAERSAGVEALIPLRLFTNPASGVPLLVSVFVGFGMFGAMITLPLWLQIVHGFTPIQSGLAMLPFTAGIMTASVISGQLISRTGRYKVFPIIGTGLLTVGAFMLSRVTIDADMWFVSMGMTVFGLGLGNCMQPLTLAVQNAVDRRDMGMATSAATFFRQLGGTLGTAIFLSILFSTVQDKIADAYGRAVGTPEFTAALQDPAVVTNPVNEPVLQMLHGGEGGGGSSLLSDTSFLSRIDPRLARPFQEGFSNSITLVLTVAIVVLAVTWVLTFFVPERELATRAPHAAPTAEVPQALQAAASSAPTSAYGSMGARHSAGTASTILPGASTSPPVTSTSPPSTSPTFSVMPATRPLNGSTASISDGVAVRPGGHAAPVPVTGTDPIDADDTTARGTVMLDHPFPLRPGLQGRLILPEDLTKAEAERLGAFLVTLAVPATWHTERRAEEDETAPAD